MRITISDEGYVEKQDVVGNTMAVDYREPETFMDALATRTPFRTGLLPPGLLSYRQAGEHAQIVLCLEPAVNLICWGEYERDANAKFYHLAQPYRIVIAETNKGELIGARTFYSPVLISRGEQLLYHSNLPNENHKGYGGTAVGWNCLYHNTPWKGLDLAAKIANIGVRVSGNEVYNNANMSGTDGPRFYAAEYQKLHKVKANTFKYLWDPIAWEKKSKDGYAWTLNANLWIPVLVKGLDNQNAHTPGGVPLTLDMAMNGRTKYHYHDTDDKDFHAFVRDDVNRPDTVSWAKAAFAAAAKVAAPDTTMSNEVLADIGPVVQLAPIGAAPMPAVGAALPAMD